MRVVLGVCFFMAFTVGCGDSVDSGTVATSEASIDAGLAAFEGGQWEEAEKQLSTAMTGGGLRPDMAEQAIRSLARARIQLGKLEQAESDLNGLEAGAADMDQLWIARAELFLKKGDRTAAKNAVAEAKKLNRSVKLPASLNGF